MVMSTMAAPSPSSSFFETYRELFGVHVDGEGRVMVPPEAVISAPDETAARDALLRLLEDQDADSRLTQATLRKFADSHVTMKRAYTAAAVDRREQPAPTWIAENSDVEDFKAAAAFAPALAPPAARYGGIPTMRDDPWSPPTLPGPPAGPYAEPNTAIPQVRRVLQLPRMPAPGSNAARADGPRKASLMGLAEGGPASTFSIAVIPHELTMHSTALDETQRAAVIRKLQLFTGSATGRVRGVPIPEYVRSRIFAYQQLQSRQAKLARLLKQER